MVIQEEISLLSKLVTPEMKKEKNNVNNMDINIGPFQIVNQSMRTN